MKFLGYALFLGLLGVALVGGAQTPPPPRPQTSTAASVELSPGAATQLQQRAEAFLRNLYAWGPEFQVKAGPVKPSPLAGLYEINIEVSIQGESDSAVIYVSRDGRYIVRGEINDMDVDPFAEVRQKMVLDGYPSKGPVDAKVVIVEFGDYQCPSCRQLDLILRRLLPQFPQVRFVFKDFPLVQIHPWAMTAAVTGRCAYKQSSDGFWKLHDLIYDNQDSITPETAQEKLLRLAVEAGLNPESLRTCVADPQTTTAIRNSLAEGAALGVNSTPTAFVNGRSVVGANEPLLGQYAKYALRP
jgi:protein-disulfide isomerase